MPPGRPRNFDTEKALDQALTGRLRESQTVAALLLTKEWLERNRGEVGVD